MRMPWLPATAGAWGFTASGLAGLVFALWMQAPMWAVEFGRRSVSPGGGEYLTALIFGAPALILASVLLGIAVSREAWRSKVAVVLVFACLLNLSTWALLFARAASAD